MMPFLNDLPYMLPVGDCQFDLIENNDGPQGWHIHLPNKWVVSVLKFTWASGLSVAAWPDFRNSLPYNFSDSILPDFPMEVLGNQTPEQVLEIILLISDLPPEIPSDTPDGNS